MKNADSTLTKSIYKNWNLTKISSIMLSKFSTSLYHQLPLNRCPLNQRCYEIGTRSDGSCRFGCHQKETPVHIFLQCPFLLNNQNEFRNEAKKLKIRYGLPAITKNVRLKIMVEKLLIKVFSQTQNQEEDEDDD